MIWIIIAVSGIITTIATLFVREHVEQRRRAGNFSALKAKQEDLIRRTVAATGQHWTDGRTAQEILDDQTQEAFEAAWITPNEDLCAEIDRELGITPEPIAPTYEPRPITHTLEEKIVDTLDGRTTRTVTGLVRVDPAASLPQSRPIHPRGHNGQIEWTQTDEGEWVRS